MLGLDLVRLERGQALEAQVEDRLRLDARELEALDQPVARDVRVARAADQLDDLVDVLDRDEQALEDVEAGLLLAQLVLRAPHDDVGLVVDVVLDDRQQAERPRHAVDQRDHVHAEGRLELGVLVELVEDDLRDRVALQLDDEPDARLVGLVAQVRDLLEPAVLDLLDDLLHEAAAVAAAVALVDLEGHLGDDDALLAALHRLDVRPAAHDHAAAAGLVRVADAAVPDDDAAGREVGALQVLHQALDVDLRVVDEGHDRVDRLAQVVRRDVRGHADRDARRAVDQQVREARRQDERLLARLVVVRAELDGVRVDVAQHLRGEPRQARLGVPHRGRSVVVDRAEVPLRVDQRVAHREVLAEPDQGVVDRRVAVGVVVPHDAADDVRALAVRAPGLEPGVEHRVEDAAVDRLEPVAHVR